MLRAADKTNKGSLPVVFKCAIALDKDSERPLLGDQLFHLGAEGDI